MKPDTFSDYCEKEHYLAINDNRVYDENHKEQSTADYIKTFVFIEKEASPHFELRLPDSDEELTNKEYPKKSKRV